MTTKQLLSTLHANVRALVETAETEFLTLPDHALNTKEAPDRWSILECLEHLNRYSRYYHAALALSIDRAKAKKQPVSATAQSTWLGKQFIAMVHPSNAKKQKTFKSMNPAQSLLTRAVIDEWLHHQRERLHLLSEAQAINVNQSYVPVSFAKLLKLNVGDAFQLLVAHEQRHMLQALRAKAKAMPASSPVLQV